MVVWKLLAHDYTSIFFNFQWIVGRLNRTELKVTYGVFCFTYYDDKVYDCYASIDRSTLVEVSKGFHAFADEARLDAESWSSDRRQKVKCLIPKGSEVFEDLTGLIVSNQMMLL